MYVLDTNTVIHFFAGKGDVGKRMMATPLPDLAIPAVVVYELMMGLFTSRSPRKRQEDLDFLLGMVRVLPFGVQEARAAALARADLERRGLPIGPCDVLIAGTALASSGVLVTRNVGEFSRVRGLKVENWYSSDPVLH
jgi:tRNA(fMet)-specific endonuclease VapC